MPFFDEGIVITFDKEVCAFVLIETHRQHDLYTRLNTYGYAVTSEKY